MPQQSTLKMTGKCTTCQKTWTLTEADMKEAQKVGVPFSPCCQSVATISKVAVRHPRA